MASKSLNKKAKRKATDDKNPLELRSKRCKSAALGSSVTDQPDGAKDRGEPVYVQVTVLSKKVGTHHGSSEDGTIILSPFSESLVSYPPKMAGYLDHSVIIGIYYYVRPLYG